MTIHHSTLVKAKVLSILAQVSDMNMELILLPENIQIVFQLDFGNQKRQVLLTLDLFQNSEA